jgi:hypothetical protein
MGAVAIQPKEIIGTFELKIKHIDGDRCTSVGRSRSVGVDGHIELTTLLVADYDPLLATTRASTWRAGSVAEVSKA